jgi:hypothetical protein
LDGVRLSMDLLDSLEEVVFDTGLLWMETRSVLVKSIDVVLSSKSLR